MDGIVMGGGMGISQGAALRLVTERTKLAMPETAIGLFPDVGGGYFLSRCPGHTGEWLALTGETIGADEALALGLADARLELPALAPLWDELGSGRVKCSADIKNLIATKYIASSAHEISARAKIDHYFSMDSVSTIVGALEASAGEWEAKTAATLRKRSPLMLHVVLEQIRRGRTLSLSDDLRMERDMVRHCFYLRPGQSETLEGIRALAGGQSVIPAAVLPVGFLGAYEANLPARDLEGAKALLAEARYADGLELDLSYPDFTYGGVNVGTFEGGHDGRHTVQRKILVNLASSAYLASAGSYHFR